MNRPAGGKPRYRLHCRMYRESDGEGIWYLESLDNDWWSHICWSSAEAIRRAPR